MKSLALHGALVGVMLLIAYSARISEDPPRIIELVAGPGDDYTAKEAPALGDPNSVKLQIPRAVPAPTPVAPTPPVVQPEPPAVRPVQEATPIVPAPVPQPAKKETPKTVPKQKEPDPAKNMSKDLKAQVTAAKRKAQREAEKERKKQEELAKKMSKEEFDRLNAQKNAQKKVASVNSPTKGAATKVPLIDAKGIRDGVAGGSSNSKVGAGGKALTREEATLMDLYYSDLRQKLRTAYEEDRPPGLSDSLEVKIELRSNQDGSLSNIRVVDPSGIPEFDRAVVAAVRRIKLAARPIKDGGQTITFVFSMRE